MFEFMKGQVVAIRDNKIILEVGPIGYLIFCPLSTLSHLYPGETVKLYLHQVIREDAHTLYGFRSEDERMLFEMVCGVNGIGPKTGLNLISHLDAQRLCEAVYHENVALLSKVPGIGKKTAERLIVELKDKLSKKMLSSQSGSSDNSLYEALFGLGFTLAQIEPCMKEIRSEQPDIKEEPLLLKKMLQKLHARQVRK